MVHRFKISNLTRPPLGDAYLSRLFSFAVPLLLFKSSICCYEHMQVYVVITGDPFMQYYLHIDEQGPEKNNVCVIWAVPHDVCVLCRVRICVH